MEAYIVVWWCWRLPRVRGFGDNVRPFIPRLRVFVVVVVVVVLGGGFALLLLLFVVVVVLCVCVVCLLVCFLFGLSWTLARAH